MAQHVVIMVMIQNVVLLVSNKVKRPKQFLSDERLVLANAGEREKDVDVDTEPTEKYPGREVSTASSSRMDVEPESRIHAGEASRSSTVEQPICPISVDQQKVSLSFSSQVSDEATHSSEKDETFHPVPLVFRDFTPIPEVNDSYVYSAVESFHPDPNSFLALIDARLQVDGCAEASVVALQEHDYTESLFPAADERTLTESLFPASQEGRLTESLFPAALEDHSYTMSLFPEELSGDE